MANSSNKSIAFPLWAEIGTLIFNVLALILFIVPSFVLSRPILEDKNMSFYDLFNYGNSGIVTMMVFIVVFISLILINNVILTCEPKLRSGVYSKITSIAQLLMTGALALIYIVLSVKVLGDTRVSIAAGYAFATIVFTVLIALSLTSSIFKIKHLND